MMASYCLDGEFPFKKRVVVALLVPVLFSALLRDVRDGHSTDSGGLGTEKMTEIRLIDLNQAKRLAENYVNSYASAPF